LNNNIFISTTFFKDNSKISEVLDFCQKNNLLNLELGSNHLWEKNQLETVQNYKNNNYLLHNYFPAPKEFLIVNIASTNSLIRNKSILHAKKCIHFAKIIDAKIYTLHFGFLRDPINKSANKTNYDFAFNNSDKSKINYDLTFKNLVESLYEIMEYANKHQVQIAFETEGSFNKDFCFMSQIWEYEKLFKIFADDKLKLNLNIGHLNLEISTGSYTLNSFLSLVKNRVIAIELSHNNGRLDQHLPIKKNEWYWSIINDINFNNCYQILEFRDTKIQDIKNCLNFFNS